MYIVSQKLGKRLEMKLPELRTPGHFLAPEFSCRSFGLFLRTFSVCILGAQKETSPATKGYFLGKGLLICTVSYRYKVTSFLLWCLLVLSYELICLGHFPFVALLSDCSYSTRLLQSLAIGTKSLGTQTWFWWLKCDKNGQWLTKTEGGRDYT